MNEIKTGSHTAIPVVDADAYCRCLTEAWRPNVDKVQAFYDDRLGVICKDGRMMLMPWDDHLVHRGDGVFETMKFLDRKLYQLDAHLARMQRSSAAIFLEPPKPWAELREIALEVARASGQEMGYLRLLMGRGPGGFGIDPMECPVPSFYAVVYRFTPKAETVFEKGLTAFRTSIPAKQGWIARIKSIDYLPNVLMKREAVSKGYDVPFCFDRHGFLAEGATENVCLVDAEGTIVVPEFSNSLAGTTLLRAIELIEGERQVVFRKISEDELYEAHEIIVVGTTFDAISVMRYNGQPVHDVRPGPVSRRMRELLTKDLVEHGVPF